MLSDNEANVQFCVICANVLLGCLCALFVLHGCVCVCVSQKWLYFLRKFEKKNFPLPNSFELLQRSDRKYSDQKHHKLTLDVQMAQNRKMGD